MRDETASIINGGDPLGRVLDHLQNVRQANGGFQASCPAPSHGKGRGDMNPSLSIARGDDGRVLLRCHVGCNTAEILDAMGLSMGDLFEKPAGNVHKTNGHRKITEIYSYTDEAGKLLFQCLRYQPKGFSQRKPDGAGGWIRERIFENGTRPILYRLPKVLEAVREGRTVWLVEGEKDVHRLEREGLTATTNPMGAESWRDHLSEPLDGADVVILPDNDPPGRRHALKVARSLRGRARSVKIVELPGVPEDGGDFSDWMDAGGTVEELKELAARTPEWEQPEQPEQPEHEANGKPGATKQRNQADRLIDLALATGAELFLDQHDQPHALIEGEAVALTSRAYNWLRGLMWEREGISVGGEALKTAVGTLAAFAVSEGKTRKLYTRAAWHEGAVYYQLKKGRVWKIDRDGHALAENPPVVFRNIRNLKPLPDPEPGGTLNDLVALANIKSDLGRRLWLANTVTTLLEHIPRPIEEYTGEAGAGKSTNSRLKKRLLDPTVPESVRLDPRDFLQKADHAFIVMLDNQNSLPEWAVDTLCRIVTGEGDSKRVLYTDDEDHVFEMKRAIILNGINQPTDRNDARDRTLPIELRRIPDDERKPEEELWAAFAEKHPRLLGAVLNALSRALRAKGSVRLPKRPRLADWGEYAASVYEAEGWSKGGKKGADLFLDDWEKVVRIQNRGTLEGSSVAQVVLAFMQDRDEYIGLATDLYGALKSLAEHEMNIDVIRDRTWPRSPSWLWRRIREVKPTLRAVGILAENKSSAQGSWILLTKDGGGDDPPDNGSKAADASIKEPGASMMLPSSKPDTYGNPGSNGSNGSICGHSLESLSQTEKIEGDKKGNNPPIFLKGTENASTATIASMSDSKLGPQRRLSEKEARQVQKLVAEGMGAKLARDVVLGEAEIV